MEALLAWSTLALALATFALAVMAFCAWSTAKATLGASTEANKQTARDSVEQTRPYVYAEILPSLASTQLWDLKITNVGRSSARNLTMDYDAWPSEPDDVSRSLREMFTTPRTLPPNSSIRVYWRLVGTAQRGAEGLGTSGHISVAYTSDDPSHPEYHDVFDVMIDKTGMQPAGEDGPNPGRLSPTASQFYRLGQTLVRRVAELGR